MPKYTTRQPELLNPAGAQAPATSMEVSMWLVIILGCWLFGAQYTCNALVVDIVETEEECIAVFEAMGGVPVCEELGEGV